MNLGLDDKTAVVLASSAGIGRGIATSLLREGCRVSISGRDSGRLRNTLDDLTGRFGERVRGSTLDVRDIPALREHIDATTSELGPVDILVWNSGGPPPGSAVDVDSRDLEDAYRLLLDPAVAAIRHVLPSMGSRSFGRILAVTSITVREPIGSLSLSNVMRSALTAYLKSLSLDVARDGILVNSICTGMFDTDRLQSLFEQRAAASGRSVAEERTAVESSIPIGRLGTPEEYGDLVAFLASERASYLNGVALPIDGGLAKSLL